MNGSGTWKTEVSQFVNSPPLKQQNTLLMAGIALRAGNEQDVGLSDANPILPTAAGVAVGVKFLRSRIL